jgi:hypothetical protein
VETGASPVQAERSSAVACGCNDSGLLNQSHDSSQAAKNRGEHGTEFYRIWKAPIKNATLSGASAPSKLVITHRRQSVAKKIRESIGIMEK